jgi:hypothetical protein
MTTRAELAFKALDKDNSGYITGIYCTLYKYTVLYKIYWKIFYFSRIVLHSYFWGVGGEGGWGTVLKYKLDCTFIKTFTSA